MEKEWFDFLLFLFRTYVISLIFVFSFLSVLFYIFVKILEKNLSDLAGRIGNILQESEYFKEVFITKEDLNLFFWKKLEDEERIKVAKFCCYRGNRNKASFLVSLEEDNELLRKNLISLFDENKEYLGEIKLIF